MLGVLGARLVVREWEGKYSGKSLQYTGAAVLSDVMSTSVGGAVSLLTTH